MPILVDIMSVEGGGVFHSDLGGVFHSDAGGVFNDQIGHLRLTTSEGFSGTHAWSPDVINIDPIAWRMDNFHGGFCRLGGAGSIEIAMSAFDATGWWFPATTYKCRISYTDGAEYLAIPLMDCTLYRKTTNPPLSFSFDVYPEQYNTDLLSTATNYDGETVVLPQAFGTVSYVVPVRLADAGGGNRRYSAGGLTTVFVYDDGVDVTVNAVQPVSNVFEYTVAPVGEITISGTRSGYEYIEEIFAQLCGSSYLNVGLVTDVSGAASIDKWVDAQIRVVDFLSSVSIAESVFFFFVSGTMHLRNFAGYSPALVVDIETDTLSGTGYNDPVPASLFRYSWKKRTAVEETIGKYVKETDLTETLMTAYPDGEEIEVDAMTQLRSEAAFRLLLAYDYYQVQQVALELPLSGDVILPGTELDISDGRYTGRETSNVAGFVKGIIYDFMGKKITVEGKGAFFN